MAKREKRSSEIGIVDFFCGCGGMSYGFRQASSPSLRYGIRGALDFDRHAVATYRRMLGINPMCRDIRELAAPAVLREAARSWGINKRDPWILIGCAPCQGFSSHRKKDSRKDKRNSLLLTFANAISRLKPDLVVMENVPEIFQSKHWAHYKAWRDIVEAGGYTVRARIYNLAQFGVPQERYRALIIAARDWKHFSMPEPSKRSDEFVTVRQAIGTLPVLKSGECDSTDPMHITSRHRPSTINLIRHIPADGGSRKSLPKGIGLRCWKGVDGFRDVYGRLAWDKPAVAITARCRTPSCGRFVHPEQHRGLSVREAAFLQGFPADYYFEGPFDDKYKQIGNAVSPQFAEQVAKHIAREWKLDHSRTKGDSPNLDVMAPIEKSISSSLASMKRNIRTLEELHATA